MNPYQHLVSEYARFAREGRTYPLGTFAPLPRPQVAPDAPKVLIFSPHPDDEVIVGGLALRLLREAKWNVINVAVTQGSKKERQAERLRELKNCCDCIGFGLAHRNEAVHHSMPYAREMDANLAEKFIGMYVNDYTRDYGDVGRSAVREFLRTAHRRGYLEKEPAVEFVE